MWVAAAGGRCGVGGGGGEGWGGGVGGGGAERHDSASGSCIELDLRNCIEIDQIGRIESDKINLFVYFEEPQSLELLRLIRIACLALHRPRG